MFYVRYALAELRRRSGRTLLTALGLAVGVGLVVTVNALATGLDRAQDEVLRPLTGVGTDMSVTRPITFDDEGETAGGGRGAFPGPRLSAAERDALEKENGSARFGLRNLGEPGESFSRDSFMATSQLSFPTSEVSQIRSLDGVSEAAGGLTLTALHIEGTVPDQPRQPGAFGAPPGAGAGPRNINVDSVTVGGVDQTRKVLGAITPGQISSGRYFSAGSKREVVLNAGYAQRRNLGLGDTVKLGGKEFTVVGLARTPLGGQASDVYVKLGQLQVLSDRKGRVNTVYVRAESGDDVAAVSKAITSSFDGASVTTAEDLADRVSGSLVDAKNLAGSLGTVLAVVGLLAAVLIASLLTLSSVAKRIRELGTLKALGWRQRLVVRQVAGEALLQGLLGGLLGVAVGLAGVAVVDALAPTLEATVAEAEAAGPRLIGPFGQGAVTAGSTDVSLDASASLGLLGLAVALAVAGGLVAGAVGALRAARLRPADALRHID